jgi:hypothetical protein
VVVNQQQQSNAMGGNSMVVNMNGVVTGQDLVNLLSKWCQQHGSLPPTVKIRGATA